MKKLTILASVIASLCLAFGFVTMPKAYAADGYSAKTYVPDATDCVNYWGGADNLSENDGGGVFTFAHASFTVPLEGRAIEMNTLFKMLSKKSLEEGGNGIDGWATYSFSATPGEERDNTFPYYGGAKDGASIYTQKIYWELQNIMRLANCRTLKDITMDKLVFLNKR